MKNIVALVLREPFLYLRAGASVRGEYLKYMRGTMKYARIFRRLLSTTHREFELCQWNTHARLEQFICWQVLERSVVFIYIF